MPDTLCTLVSSDLKQKKLIKITYDTKDDLVAQLEKAASNKLKVKKALLYIDGILLKDVDDIPKAITITASSSDIRAVQRKTDVVKVIFDSDTPDRHAKDQLEEASRLSGMYLCRGLRNLTPGAVYPTGAMYISTDMHPELVGGDIGCGISVFQTGIKVASLNEKLERINRRLQRYTFGSQSECWGGTKESWMLKYDNLYGTIAAGDVCALYTGHEIDDTTFNNKYAYLVVKSGTFGIGAETLKRYSKDTELYIKHHDICVQWASSHRKCVAEQFFNCIHTTGELFIDQCNTCVIYKHPYYTHFNMCTAGITTVGVVPDGDILYMIPTDDPTPLSIDFEKVNKPVKHPLATLKAVNMQPL